MNLSPDPVSSADRNAVISLLYRWWGLFELPDRAAAAQHIDDVLGGDVVLAMQAPGPIELRGLEAARASLAHLPADDRRAHWASAIVVHDLGSGRLGLDVEFEYQTFPADATLRAGLGSYRHEVVRRSDGSLVFDRIGAQLGAMLERTEFRATSMENRARATVIQFQAVVDRLDGSGAGFEELVTADATFEGLAAKGIDGGIAVRGPHGLAAWIAEGPVVFRSTVHDLDSFVCTQTAQDRCSAVVTFHWTAVTQSGRVLEERAPRVWHLIDTGERYMRIEASSLAAAT